MEISLENLHVDIGAKGLIECGVREIEETEASLRLLVEFEGTVSRLSS